MRCSARANIATRVSQKVNGKGVGEADRVCGVAERVSVGEGISIVLSSSRSITPPSGEGEALQQMVSGTQWNRQKWLRIP